MDSKKSGTFLAAVRKERNMTQSELGEKLHVTDKAVSRWERGVGLPDIHLLEPLAESLGISVLELMRSERIEQEPICEETASEAISNALELARTQRKQDRQIILKLLLAFLGIAVALFGFQAWYTHSSAWELFFFFFLPLGGICVSIAFLIYGIFLLFQKKPCANKF